MKNLARFLGLGSAAPEIIVQAKAEEIPEEVNQKDDKDNVHHIDVSEIIPNPYQPRKVFHNDSLQELAASIQEYGVIQPLIVRNMENGFELVAGERRLRASKLAGLQ